MNREAVLKTISSQLTQGQVNQLIQLSDEVKLVEGFAHEYDFYPGVKANGFRSWVKIVDSYFGTLLALKDNAFLSGQLHQMIPGLLRQSAIMNLVREKKNFDDRTSFTEADLKILKACLAFPDEEIKPFFGPLEMFFLNPAISGMYRKLLSLPMIPLLTMEEKLKFFSDAPDNWTVSRDFKVKRWSAPSLLDVSESRAMKDLGVKFAMMLFKDMIPPAPGIEKKEIKLSLLTYWKIDDPGAIMSAKPQKYPVKILDKRESARQNVVDAVYINPIGNDGKLKSQDDSLIIHCHGGGFVGMHPREHANYLGVWSQKLEVAVLAPNYKKAPENKFPAGLQDCLDTFLFVTSGRPEVKELLGFHPKKVLLTGDSAGGNLAASVTIALNEIRRNNGKNVIKMPTAIVAQYPYSDPSLIMTPSEALSPLTPVIGPRPLTSLMLAYPPTGILSPRDDWFERGEEISTWARILSPSFKEPLINNLAYTHFDELSDVPLYVHVCEFDPLLDEGLILAKKWSAVKVDLIADIHGWCLFGQEVTHKDKFDLIISRMAEALEIRKT
jgi:acetyl esterase/lipase